MDQPAPSKHTGRKVWYGFVIVLSAIVLITCVVAVIGSWALQSTLSDATVSLLQTAGNVAGRARAVIAQVDEPLGEIHTIAKNVADVSAKLKQDVQNEGLLKLLLPPEQEQKLSNLATKIQDTLATVQEVLGGAVELYQSIDRLPFISLPKPSMDKLTEVQQTVTDIRVAVEEIKAKVAEVRAGAAEKIGVVNEIATRIYTRLEGAQTRLAELDSNLADFQQRLAALEGVVPTVFALAALLISLFFVFIGYTQVEVVRLFVRRWKSLGAPPAELAEVATPAVESSPPPAAPEPPPAAEDAAPEPSPEVAERGEPRGSGELGEPGGSDELGEPGGSGELGEPSGPSA